MRTLLASVVSLSLVLVAAGCGGGLSNLVPNSLAGSYTGTGSASSSTDVFQANITIGSDGTLSGTLTDTTNRNVATVGGNVSVLGILSSGSISVVNSSNTVIGSGSLAGTFTQESSGQSGIETVDASLTATVSGSATIFTFNNLQGTNPLVLHR